MENYGLCQSASKTTCNGGTYKTLVFQKICSSALCVTYTELWGESLLDDLGVPVKYMKLFLGNFES